MAINEQLEAGTFGETPPEEQAALEKAVPTAPTVLFGKEVTRKLKVEIDDPTLSAFGNELADLIQTLERLEDDKKATANGYKCQIDSVSARARELANLIRAKCRYLDVTCREERDFSRNEFILRRLDTYAQVETRPLRDDEKQVELPLDEEEPLEEEPLEEAGGGDRFSDPAEEVDRFSDPAEEADTDKAAEKYADEETPDGENG